MTHSRHDNVGLPINLRGTLPSRAGRFPLHAVPHPFNDTRGSITECDALSAPVHLPFHDGLNSQAETQNHE